MGITTGLRKLDALIGGVLQPGLHSIQGGPGSGKTAFALQIAATCGLPALFVTCEQSPMELLRRITARVIPCCVNKFYSGELTPDASCQMAQEAIATCPQLAILDCTRGYAGAFEEGQNGTPINLYNLAKSIRGESKHVLVMIDSLHTWAGFAPNGGTEYESLNEGILTLRSLSLALDCAVVAIGEIPKGQQGKDSALNGAGTRKIGFSAETVMELEKNGGKDSVETSVKLTLRKNRHGEDDKSIDLKFNGAFMKFREVL
jgi:replicative DNA helicase